MRVPLGPPVVTTRESPGSGALGPMPFMGRDKEPEKHWPRIRDESGATNETQSPRSYVFNFSTTTVLLLYSFGFIMRTAVLRPVITEMTLGGQCGAVSRTRTL